MLISASIWHLVTVLYKVSVQVIIRMAKDETYCKMYDENILFMNNPAFFLLSCFETVFILNGFYQ